MATGVSLSSLQHAGSVGLSVVNQRERLNVPGPLQNPVAIVEQWGKSEDYFACDGEAVPTKLCISTVCGVYTSS